jgi:catechol 2,3-dioxygenase-like lactoylglutathione lyase family enzyme
MTSKFEPRVFQLGYVALETADIDRSKDHYLETIGMTETGKEDSGSVYLSIGYEHHNIVLRRGQQKSLLHLGFQLKPGTDLRDFVGEARDYGVGAELKSDSQPGISKLVEIEVAGGNVFQFYTDIEAPAPGFKKTGVAPLRLGHVAVISTEGEKLQKFYQDFLGFWYTDDFEGIATFLTCNRDHHVVNVVKLPESRVHHIAFQLKGSSDHAVACDALRKAGVKTLWGPARHTAGHNIAGYHYDPDRVLVELYTDMDVFIPELGMCEARPWHEHFPMKPKSWKLDELNAWGAEYGFNLAQA